MKKRISLLITGIMIFTFFGISAFADGTAYAMATQSNILLNGQNFWCSGFNILGYNYFKLRDLAEKFSGTSSRFDVGWNDESNSIEIITGKDYTPVEQQENIYYYSGESYPAQPTTSNILIDGSLQSITAYNINGSNYFQLRDLGKLIPFDVEWDEKANSILLYSRVPRYAHRLETAHEGINNSLSSYFPRWRDTITSYVVNNSNKTISLVEAQEDITIETYNERYDLVSKNSIKYELPLFGGFFSGDKYNYIAYGQNNEEENDNKEVIRIVRYDKNFKRIDSISVKGGEAYTIRPFEAGCGRMAEDGNILVFHTSRTRYTTEDGLNHQSQLTIIVNTQSMKVTNNLGRFQSNHVSHSFDQYVLFDNGSHVLLDHGDAYPRSVVLNKEYGDSYKEADLFKIPGPIGANATGVSVGGFEAFSENYIAAINSIDHSLVSEYTSYGTSGLEIDQRDIILCTLPKNDIDSSRAKQITLAEYVGSDKIASIPQMVKISDDKLMVLWKEYDAESRKDGDLKYVFVDGNGKAVTQIQTMKDFKLSSCKPVKINNSVVWYVNEYGFRFFYSIPLD